METHGINPIDMPIKPTPFAETVAKEGCTLADAVEKYRHRWPNNGSLCSKNHKMEQVVNAHDYERAVAEMDANEKSLTLETRLT